MLVQKAMLSIPLWAGLRVQFSEGKLFPSESSRGPSSLSPRASKQVCGSNVIVEAWEGQEALSSGPRLAGLGVTLRGKGAVADEKGARWSSEPGLVLTPRPAELGTSGVLRPSSGHQAHLLCQAPWVPRENSDETQAGRCGPNITVHLLGWDHLLS